MCLDRLFLRMRIKFRAKRCETILHENGVFCQPSEVLFLVTSTLREKHQNNRATKARKSKISGFISCRGVSSRLFSSSSRVRVPALRIRVESSLVSLRARICKELRKLFAVDYNRPNGGIKQCQMWLSSLSHHYNQYPKSPWRHSN